MNLIKKDETIFSFSSISDFYKEATILENTGHSSRFEIYSTFSSSWADSVDYSKEFIKKVQWGDKEGLKEMKKIDRDLDIIGRSSFIDKWDYSDGMDINMERLYDDIPFLKRRIRTIGNNNGKFITLNIDISIPACVPDYQIRHKALSIISFIDYLETLGFRLEIILYCNSKGQGNYNYVDMPFTTTKIVLKKAEEPLNLPLMLTAISPWMLRYWMFMLWCAKFKPDYGFGCPTDETKDHEQGIIWINNYDCLHEQSTIETFNTIKKSFNLMK